MIFPGPIKNGDCVGLVAPGSLVRENEFLGCVCALQDLGYQVKMGQSVWQGTSTYEYLAGNAWDRAKDLHDMFADPQVRAIFCIRGGYGSVELLEYLDYGFLAKNPKHLIGYSDITSLHAAIQRYAGLATLHGPMVWPDLSRNRTTEETIRNGNSPHATCGSGIDSIADTVKASWKSLHIFLDAKSSWYGRGEMNFKNPKELEFRPIIPGRGTGNLVGGNLSVLARSLGTPYAPQTQGSILFLEDVGETQACIHMYLTQMRYAGMFSGVKGILLGGFTECGKNGDALELYDFLGEWLKPLGIPVLGNVYSDHRTPMGTLPMGAYCQMDAEAGVVRFFRRNTKPMMQRRS